MTPEIKDMEQSIADLLFSFLNVTIEDTVKSHDISTDPWNEYWAWLTGIKTYIQKSLTEEV